MVGRLCCRYLKKAKEHGDWQWFYMDRCWCCCRAAAQRLQKPLTDRISLTAYSLWQLSWWLAFKLSNWMFIACSSFLQFNQPLILSLLSQVHLRLSECNRVIFSIWCVTGIDIKFLSLFSLRTSWSSGTVTFELTIRWHQWCWFGSLTRKCGGL